MDRQKRRKEESELVNPREFMSFWGLEAHEATRVKPSSSTIQANIAAAMNVSQDTVAELAEVCGKKTLFTGREPKKKANLYKMNEQPPRAELQCLKHQIASNKKREENPGFSVVVKNHMKYTVQDAFMSIVPEGKISKPSEPEFEVPTPNVILVVEINKCLLRGVYGQTEKERDVYQVLGSQSLTDLRDKIRCSSDKMIPGDYSNVPDIDTRTLQTTGDMFKSSFFFIENVFYNDMRLPDNKDYSKTIITWAKDHLPDTEFTTKELADFTFFDLNIRLGRHYLFTHQGNCEHSVVFTDLRLFNAADYQDVRLYPMYGVTRSRVRDVCQACCTFSARWCVSNSPLVPSEPTLLCGNCFKSLLYREDGSKTSDFKAFHYVS